MIEIMLLISIESVGLFFKSRITSAPRLTYFLGKNTWADNFIQHAIDARIIIITLQTDSVSDNKDGYCMAFRSVRGFIVLAISTIYL